MIPIIIDPANFDKEQNLLDGIECVFDFCQRNQIIPPKIDTSWRRNLSKMTSIGLYMSHVKTIFINVNRCQSPHIKPVRMWSYTGYKVDKTPAGVICHECGHYVWDLADIRRDLEKLNAWKAIVAEEASVSGYEPNSEESFAEAFRLFILNPTLLLQGRPKRYGFMRDLGLVECHSLPWKSVLVNAHPSLLIAADNWMQKKKSRKKG